MNLPTHLVVHPDAHPIEFASGNVHFIQTAVLLRAELVETMRAPHGPSGVPHRPEDARWLLSPQDALDLADRLRDAAAKASR